MKLLVRKATPEAGHVDLEIEEEIAINWDFAEQVIAVGGVHVRSYNELLAVTEPLKLQGIEQVEVLMLPRMVGG